MTSEKRFGVRGPVGVGIMFASNGVMFAALLPWYPLMASRLDLSAVQFGFIVASFAVGALLSSALPAPLIARFGPVRVAVGGTVLLAAAVASAGWATSGLMLALSLFLAGFADAVVDVAQNVAGIRVQDAVGRSILSSMHALWSLGGLLGGVVSTAVAASGALDIRAYLGLIAAAGVGLVGTGGAMIGAMARNPDVAFVNHTEATSRGQLLKVVLLGSLPLVAVAIGGTMVEDIGNNWAAMAGVQIGGLSPEVAGVVFSVMIGSQCVGRFTGDLMIQRFGRAAVAGFGGLLIAIGGLAVMTTTSDVGRLLFGVALAGFGSATLVPSALSAAAKLPGVSEGAGVTIVSWLMRLGFLVTSPVIGGLTSAVGLRWGLGVLVIAGVSTLVLAPSLKEPSTVAGGDRRAKELV